MSNILNSHYVLDLKTVLLSNSICLWELSTGLKIFGSHLQSLPLELDASPSVQISVSDEI